MRYSSHGLHRDQAAHLAGVVEALQIERHPHALNDGDAERGVARPLVDLAPACLTFLLQPLDGGNDHREELEDDGRADVGHDAEGEDRHLLQRAAGEEVEEVEESRHQHRRRSATSSPGRRRAK